MWKLIAYSLLAVLSCTLADDSPFRNFTVEFNMGCNSSICWQTSPEVVANSSQSNSSFHQLPNLLYLHGALASPPNGIQDTLHVVFTTYGGYPSVLVVHCNSSAGKLTFNWEILLSNDSTPKFGGVKPPDSCMNGNGYSFALVAVSTVDFNDSSDTAILDEANSNMTIATPFERLGWMRMVNTSDATATLVQTDPVLNNGTYFINNGTITFRMAYGSVTGQRASDLPHLQFSGNSVQFDAIFDNWLSQFKNTRLAIELLLVSDVFGKAVTDAPVSDSKWYPTQSIDDEYTPGTFTLTDWITNGALDNKLQTAASNDLSVPNGYVQFKPIAYTQPNQYTVENTINVSSTTLKTNSSQLFGNDRIHRALNRSIIATYYPASTSATTEGSYPPKYTASAINVTFGQVGDGFYSKTAWAKWTFQVGYGVPPQDAISALVIIIILVGLGIPLVLMIAGGICMVVKKLNSSDSPYQRIN